MSKFDGSFKSASARDPRAMLFLAGRLPLQGSERILPFERELNVPQKSADYVFEVVPDEGPGRFEHLEALAAWHTREVVAIRRRVSVLTAMEELEGRLLELTIVLMKEDGVPANLPEAFIGDWGGAVLRITPRFVMLWEQDGDAIVELDRPVLLPWVTLMRTSKASLEREATRIAATNDEELGSQFVTLGSAHYEEEYLRQLLRRFGKMLTPTLAAAFPFGKKILEIGFERGIEKGIEKGVERGVGQGRRAAELDLLRGILTDRFPALEDRIAPSMLDGVTDPASLVRKLAVARDESEAERLITESTR